MDGNLLLLLCFLAVVAAGIVIATSKKPKEPYYYRKDPYGGRVQGIDIPREIRAVPDPPKSVPNPMPPPRAFAFENSSRHRHDGEQFGPELEADDAGELVGVL